MSNHLQSAGGEFRHANTFPCFLDDSNNIDINANNTPVTTNSRFDPIIRYDQHHRYIDSHPSTHPVTTSSTTVPARFESLPRFEPTHHHSQHQNIISPLSRYEHHNSTNSSVSSFPCNRFETTPPTLALPTTSRYETNPSVLSEPPSIMSTYPVAGLAGILDSICAPTTIANGGASTSRSNNNNNTSRNGSGSRSGGTASGSGCGSGGGGGGGSNTSSPGSASKVRKPRRQRKRPPGWSPMPREQRVYKECSKCHWKNHVRRLCCEKCFTSKSDMKKSSGVGRSFNGGGES